MKITAYQQAVNPNVINAPAVQASQNINAYGTKGDGYNDLTAGIGQVNKVLAQKQDDEDSANVVNARNQAMTSLTEQLYGENGLFATGVGKNAEGLTDRVNDAIKKTTDDVLSQYNPRVAYAFRKNISENIANFQRVAADKEMDQKQAYDKVNYDSALSNNNQLAALNYDKPQFLQAQINQNMILMGARAKTQGWDGQILEANRINMVTNLVSGAAMAAIENKDYDTAGKILTPYKSSMDQGTYGKLMSAVKQKQEVKELNLKASEIIARHTRPDGTIDMTGSLNDADGYNGKPSTKTVQQQGILSSGDTSIDGYINKYSEQEGVPQNILSALTKAESNYNQQAVSDAGAIGLTQLMPGTAADLGVDPNDAEQNVMGGARYLKHLYDKYGNWRDALIAYNEGPGRRDSGQILPESAAYADGILKDANNVQQTENTVSAYDPEANQTLKNLIKAQCQEKEMEITQQKRDYEESIAKAMQNAGSYSGAINYLESLGDSVDMETSNRLKASAATYFGVNKNTGTTRGTRTSKAYSPDNDQKTLEVNNLKLQMGKTLTAEEIVTGNNASARLIENGYDTGGADLSNGKVMSSITDMLDNGSSKSDIHDALVASGASEETANYYVSLIDKSYDE